jgi:radical SAM-linked protein
MQRLRISFGRGAPVRFISHLDTMRCWERIFRRASIPIEYTQGFTPHPKIAVAAPLAVGFTGEAELMDVWVRKWMPPDALVMMTRRQLPAGFSVHTAREVPESLPSLQSVVCAGRYHCVASHPGGLAEAGVAVRAFLEASSFEFKYERAGVEKKQDLRPLVQELGVAAGDGDSIIVDMVVTLGQEGGARPDHVMAALGFAEPFESIHRVSLALAS